MTGAMSDALMKGRWSLKRRSLLGWPCRALLAGDKGQVWIRMWRVSVLVVAVKLAGLCRHFGPQGVGMSIPRVRGIALGVSPLLQHAWNTGVPARDTQDGRVRRHD